MYIWTISKYSCINNNNQECRVEYNARARNGTIGYFLELQQRQNISTILYVKQYKKSRKGNLISFLPI